MIDSFKDEYAFLSNFQEGNNWGDTFWGKCGGVGKNHLGKLLMEIRSNVQADVESPREPEELS